MPEFHIHNISELDAVAAELIAELGGRKKLAFSGDMGAGKTTLIQAFCRVLGVAQVVTSPTFALINEYYTARGESIYHFDLYRIEDTRELYDIGYEEYFFSDDYCFVEWPEMASELIPAEFTFIRITVNEDGSRLVVVDLDGKL